MGVVAVPGVEEGDIHGDKVCPTGSESEISVVATPSILQCPFHRPKPRRSRLQAVNATYGDCRRGRRWSADAKTDVRGCLPGSDGAPHLLHHHVPLCLLLHSPVPVIDSQHLEHYILFFSSTGLRLIRHNGARSYDDRCRQQRGQSEWRLPVSFACDFFAVLD